MEEFTREEVIDVVKTVARIFTEKPEGQSHFNNLTNSLPYSIKEEVLAVVGAAMMMQLMRAVANGDVALQNTHRNLFSES